MFISVILLVGLCIYYCLQNKLLIEHEKEYEYRRQSLLATLVHDLKTPTCAQINTLNMLKNETFGKLNSRQQEMINLTQESCRYMSDLICTIIDTCKSEACEFKLKKSEFDLSELILKLCQEVKSLYLVKNQEIEIICLQSKNIVFADKFQIERVVLNLLSNAINYGYKNTKISIFLEQKYNSFVFKVKNMSKQIPQKELATIFEKYKKTNTSRYNNLSTGLGLYLSKNIIELHGGKIFAKSYESGECIFGFELPDTVPVHKLNSNNKKQSI